jgi:hypothetical protein
MVTVIVATVATVATVVRATVGEIHVVTVVTDTGLGLSKSPFGDIKKLNSSSTQDSLG